MTNTFDIIVVGGGHAGIEACHICAVKGLQTLLITSHLDMIGQMSCNPAIGGIAKGNIVREIDALGGVMAKAADSAGIHFKMLNTSKGAAVWGNRAQADKKTYRTFVQAMLFRQKTLSVLQGMVVSLIAVNGKIAGIEMDNGERFHARVVILAMGTFLNGVAHIGMNSFPCGRLGEPPSLKLTESLRELGITSGRLKTGTSPRIDGRSVDFTRFQEQPGDVDPWAFSYASTAGVTNKASCWISKTTSQTHDIIRRNLHNSPLYSGKIKSIGPRYCPSIEDKVVRFEERETHSLFLEPEGLDTFEMYLNGLSTSLPFSVQQELIQSIDGLENARILRPGYGIEYDYFQPLQLRSTLESRIVTGLYFAGQINGTSGYEEAAGQGIVAGMNAVQQVLGNEPIIFGRESSYIGVLIDDLVTRGTEEPYRMFTARAEHRLLLRQDNSDERLMPLAFARGFISAQEYDHRKRFWDTKAKHMHEFEKIKISPEQAMDSVGEVLTHPCPVIELLKRPAVRIENIQHLIGMSNSSRDLMIGLEADIKYSGFIEKQKKEIERQKRYEQEHLPDNIDYTSIGGLLTESGLKLNAIKPLTLGQASRVPGVTPADITVLLAYLGKSGKTISWK